MIRSTTPPAEFTIGEPETDPVKNARMRDLLARHVKNSSWFEARAAEIGEMHRGKFICVAGEELFVGDEPRELYARARAAHPEDQGGFFTMYIPHTPRIRI